jgi:hypothetical protein
MNPLVQTLYAPLVAAARARFASGPGASIVDPRMTADEMTLFLVHFSSMGVKMTEPVEGWISRAGERCKVCGFGALGRALELHARNEANHHLMMIEDTRRLVARWNARHSSGLDADALLAMPPSPGVEAYVRLHEDVIAGQEPYCQLAIEYEVESLSVKFGAALVEHCVRLAGRDILAGLSFLEEHVAVDVGHTRFNEHELEKLLAQSASTAEPLGRVGSAALDAYGTFVTECLARAREDAERLRVGVDAVAE